ncbi:hypothetical protein JCM25156A_19110 [Komagataeibacter kakiaceti JCM 25156]
MADAGKNPVRRGGNRDRVPFTEGETRQDIIQYRHTGMLPLLFPLSAHIYVGRAGGKGRYDAARMIHACMRGENPGIP